MAKKVMMSNIVYEKGEDRCQCCGAFIRNIVRIDGVPFGITCADQFLPRSQQVGKNFQQKLLMQQSAQNRALSDALIQYAYANLPEALRNRSTDFYREYLVSRKDTPYTLKVLAILAVRGEAQ